MMRARWTSCNWAVMGYSVTANVTQRDMAQMCKLAAEGHFAGHALLISV